MDSKSAYNLQQVNKNSAEELLKSELDNKYNEMIKRTIMNGDKDFSITYLNETMCQRMQEYLQKTEQNQYGTAYLNKYQYIKDRSYFDPEITEVCELRYKIN